MSRNRAFRHQCGAILLETMVSFAILAVSVTVLTSTAAASFKQFRVAQERATAARIAEDLFLEQTCTREDPKPEGRGATPDGFRWHIKMFPVPRPPAQALEEPGAAHLARVSVVVQWGGTTNPHEYALYGLRLLHVRVAATP